MMASVSLAARDSFFGSTESRASSQARSFAVRKVHLPATRTQGLLVERLAGGKQQRLDQPQLLRPLRPCLVRRVVLGERVFVERFRQTHAFLPRYAVPGGAAPVSSARLRRKIGANA